MVMNQRPQSDDDAFRDLLARLDQAANTTSPPPIDAEAREGSRRTNAAPRSVSPRLPLNAARVVYILLAVNILMFVVSYILAQEIGSFADALYILGAKDNAAINTGQWWRLLTPMVLHGGIAHLLFNSWALYILGRDAERIYGSLHFIVIYGLAGLAGSIASYIFHPGALSVGASGAIFGLLGALAAFTYVARSLIGHEASKMQLGQIATLALINLAFGFIPGSNIDNAAHIGGLIVGGLCGFLLAPRYRVEHRFFGPVLVRYGPAGRSWLLVGLVFVGLVAWFVVDFGF
jgi:rhomboid protease GluP